MRFFIVVGILLLGLFVLSKAEGSGRGGDAVGSSSSSSSRNRGPKAKLIGDNPNDFLNVWPKPNSISYGKSTLYVNPAKFSFVPVGKVTIAPILLEAFRRYTQLMFVWGNGSFVSGPMLESMTVGVDSIDDDLQLGVDESYQLTINGSTGAIFAPTIWGALHALETFSQLVEWNFTNSYYNVRFAPYVIKDAPRFPWRGIMIDTGRHFLAVDTILRTIDGLAYNKLNVLHWHTSDAESVPIESKFFPDLAAKGAYSPQAIYTQVQVMDIIEYAKKRGVRVIPEFDMPGHNHAYGLGIPDVIVDCPMARPVATEAWAASFNPIKESVYSFLEVFLSEMATLFPDSVLHIGGDEVFYECWNQTQSILDYMAAHNITKLSDLYVMFEKRVHEMLKAYGKVPMAWDEVFVSAHSVLPPNAIVEVWRGDETIVKAVKSGFRVVSSGDYYLNGGFDVSSEQVQWTDIYKNDPMPSGLTPQEQSLMLGCEACMWAEQINAYNLDQRLWFRGNVFAERLWTNTMSNQTDVIIRVMKQNCRMLQRGLKCALYESMHYFPRRDLRRVCEFLLPYDNNNNNFET